MKYFTKSILITLVFVSFGCVKNTTHFAELTDRIPLAIGESHESVLNKCVTGISDDGYAIIGVCQSDLRSFFGNYEESKSGTHDVGLKKLGLTAGYNGITIGGSGMWYTEYFTEKIIDVKPKALPDFMDDQLEDLSESCKIGNKELYIDKVYIGCSTSDHIVNLDQLNAAFIKKYLNVAGKYKAEKTIGKPTDFTIGEENKTKSPSCETSQVIQVHATPIEILCNRLSIARMTSLKKKIIELNKFISRDEINIFTQKNKIEELEMNISNLNSSFDQCDETKNSLLKSASNGQQAFEVMKADLDINKIKLADLSIISQSAKQDLSQCKLNLLENAKIFENYKDNATSELDTVKIELALVKNKLKEFETLLTQNNNELKLKQDQIENFKNKLTSVSKDFEAYQSAIKSQNTERK